MPAFAHAWFLEIAFIRKVSMTLYVCVCVHVRARACVSAPKAINCIHMIFNLYNQLNKFFAFRKVMNLFMHGRGLCNEAHHDKNQWNKVVLVP